MGQIASVFDRQPKADYNRRVALGLDAKTFARIAGVTTEELLEYEIASPDTAIDLEVAARVEEALEDLEAQMTYNTAANN